MDVLIKPKMYKKYVLINENNFEQINQENVDKILDSLLISMPVKIKGQK